MSFFIDGTYLENEFGETKIRYLLEDIPRSSPSPRVRWSLVGDWLMQGPRKVLWLPPDFRPVCGAYRDGVFVLGRQSGQIAFLEVDLNYRPPE